MLKLHFAVIRRTARLPAVANSLDMSASQIVSCMSDDERDKFVSQELPIPPGTCLRVPTPGAHTHDIEVQGNFKGDTDTMRAVRALAPLILLGDGRFVRPCPPCVTMHEQSLLVTRTDGVLNGTCVLQRDCTFLEVILSGYFDIEHIFRENIEAVALQGNDGPRPMPEGVSGFAPRGNRKCLMVKGKVTGHGAPALTAKQVVFKAGAQLPMVARGVQPSLIVSAYPNVVMNEPRTLSDNSMLSAMFGKRLFTSVEVPTDIYEQQGSTLYLVGHHVTVPSNPGTIVCAALRSNIWQWRCEEQNRMTSGVSPTEFAPFGRLSSLPLDPPLPNQKRKAVDDGKATASSSSVLQSNKRPRVGDPSRDTEAIKNAGGGSSVVHPAGTPQQHQARPDYVTTDTEFTSQHAIEASMDAEFMAIYDNLPQRRSPASPPASPDLEFARSLISGDVLDSEEESST